MRPNIAIPREQGNMEESGRPCGVQQGCACHGAVVPGQSGKGLPFSGSFVTVYARARVPACLLPSTQLQRASGAWLVYGRFESVHSLHGGREERQHEVVCPSAALGASQFP